MHARRHDPDMVEMTAVGIDVAERLIAEKCNPLLSTPVVLFVMTDSVVRPFVREETRKQEFLQKNGCRALYGGSRIVTVLSEIANC